MPEHELQELREFIAERSADIPGLTLSRLIRDGIRNEMWRIENGKNEVIFKETQASNFFEHVSKFFTDEMKWKKPE